MFVEPHGRAVEIRRELYLDVYVIMPNHIHAIVEINVPGDTHGRAVEIRRKLYLDVYVIVPTHFHSIVEINVIGDTHGRADLHDNEDSRGHAHHSTDKTVSIEHDDVPVSQGRYDDIIPKNPLSINHHHPIRLPRSISSFNQIVDYIENVRRTARPCG